MPQTINTNVSSLNAQRNLNASQSSLAISMQRLSSGLRVNSAKDDAAGLAIAERAFGRLRQRDTVVGVARGDVQAAQLAVHALGDRKARGVVLRRVHAQARGEALHRDRERGLRGVEVALRVERADVGVDRLCHGGESSLRLK